jgi:hypothetical protein
MQCITLPCTALHYTVCTPLHCTCTDTTHWPLQCSAVQCSGTALHCADTMQCSQHTLLPTTFQQQPAIARSRLPTARNQWQRSAAWHYALVITTAPSITLHCTALHCTALTALHCTDTYPTPCLPTARHQWQRSAA